MTGMSGDDFTDVLKHYHQQNIDPANAAWGVAAEAMRLQMILRIAESEVAKLNTTRVAVAHSILGQLPPPAPPEPIALYPEEVTYEPDPRLQRVLDGIVRQQRGHG
jgi:hypothetical protein